MPDSLESHRNVLETIFDFTGDGILWLDTGCHIRGISRSLAVLLDISRDEAVGAECRDVLTCRDSQGDALCDGPFGCGRFSGNDYPGTAVTVTTVHPDVEPVILESVAHPIPDGAGRTTGVVRFFRKQTVRGESPARDALITRLSHELRTPLTSIQGYVDLLLSGDVVRGSELDREFLLAASKSILHLNEVISEFLTRGVEELWTGTETRSQE